MTDLLADFARSYRYLLEGLADNSTPECSRYPQTKVGGADASRLDLEVQIRPRSADITNWLTRQ